MAWYLVKQRDSRKICPEHPKCVRLTYILLLVKCLRLGNKFGIMCLELMELSITD